MSFGCAIVFFRGMKDRSEIAKHYGVPEEVLHSWLKTINVIRNICAHHSRLWNRELGVKPFIPKENKYPEWHKPVKVTQNRVFGILTILNYLLNIIAPNTNWKQRLYQLLAEYSEISKASMGFPENWEKSTLWK